MPPAGQCPAAAPGQPGPPREPLLPYNGLALDRAAGRRADEAWLRAVARHPGSRLLALWRDKCLVDASGQPVMIALAAHRAARPRTHGDSIGTYLLDAWLAEGD